MTIMITNEQIQIRLIEAIKQSGFSQSDIARKINLSPQTISCYIHGKKTPALDTFANLCVILDLDANDVLCVK